MLLGGPVFDKYDSPEQWVAAVKALGYRAAYCPVSLDASEDEIQAYMVAAQRHDIVIAEVGAWSNPLSPDEKTREQAMEKCRRSLALAERIGARCCVNIAGSRGEKWDGPCALDLTDETFEMIVSTVRAIIDEVKPTRTFYTLEPMPWMYPDSADSYLALLNAIDRPAAAAHFDPVNIICSPQHYYHNGDVVKDFIAKLGPLIKSCHAKDILLQDRLTVHLDEVRPGLGNLDYAILLNELEKLSPDIPLMLEHLPSAEDYLAAGEYVRKTASAEGIVL